MLYSLREQQRLLASDVSGSGQQRRAAAAGCRRAGEPVLEGLTVEPSWQVVEVAHFDRCWLVPAVYEASPCSAKVAWAECGKLAM